MRCGASGKRRNAADGPICSHPSGRAILAPGVVGLHLWWGGTTASNPPSQSPKSPRSNGANLSPFALVEEDLDVDVSACNDLEIASKQAFLVVGDGRVIALRKNQRGEGADAFADQITG